MKRTFLVPACLALTLLACNDETELNFNDEVITLEENRLIYQEMLSQLQFTCDYDGGSSDSSYFTGTIKGEDVCFFTEDPRYQETFYKVNGTVRVQTEPAASLANYVFGIVASSYENLYNPSISIITPSFPLTTSAEDMVTSSLLFAGFGYLYDSIRLGEIPLASNELSPLEGFSVRVNFRYDSNYFKGTQWEDFPYTILLESQIGNQAGSQLVLTDVVKTETDSAITYNLIMQLNCKLYWQSGEEAIHFGDIENGVLRARIVVDK